MTPKSWYVNWGAQSCSAHTLDGLVWGDLLQQTLALDFLSPVSRHLSAHQALVAVRRVLLAQFSAFPTNGADLYEELKSSTAILPTGSPRWVHRLASQQICPGLGLLQKAVVAQHRL